MRFKTLLILPLLVASLQAASVDDLTFTLNGGGTEYSVTDCVQSASLGLSIPSTHSGLPVTSIGSEAFSGCSSLTNIVIPDSVTSIGNRAFQHCSGLIAITIPDSVTSIGDYAFTYCTGLPNFTIPDSVTSIGEWAFSYCTGLTRFTIGDSVTSIGEWAFSYCTGLTRFTIGDSVTSIGEWAFSGCSSLNNDITIPNSVTSIGEWAFSYCTNLTRVIFEGDAPTFGSNVFSDSDSVTVYYDFSNSSWSGTAAGRPATTILTFTLNGDSTEYIVSDYLESVSGPLDIPSTYNGLPVTAIGSSAFKWCYLTSISIPDSVTSIGSKAFNYCRSLSSITIGDSVTSIGNRAFEFCGSLTSITIPNSVTSIEEYAFRYCSSLTSITFEGDAPTFGSNVFSDSDSVTVYYYEDITGFTTPTFQGRPSQMLIRADTMPRIPVLSIDSFYESFQLENITIDATPTDGYPTTYTYQWYFNGFPIPSFLDGTSPTYHIDGASSSNGTWRVEVTNDIGTTSAEFEYRVFTDGDGDGLSYYREHNILGTNPYLADSDSDGLNDYDEVNTHFTNPLLADTDSDGLSDGDEVNTYSSDPLDSDSDDDGLLDGVEVNTYSTDPNDTDSDDDQLSDADEINTHLTNPNLSDTDGDQLSDYDEIVTPSPTDPNNSDSDDDGLEDGAEINTYSSNPISADTSGDGFTDGFLVSEGFSPTTDYNALRTETVNQILDLRIGSTMIEVSDGKADITMTLEETSDLSEWSNADTSEKTIEVDAPAGTRFYRFKMTE